MAGERLVDECLFFGTTFAVSMEGVLKSATCPGCFQAIRNTVAAVPPPQPPESRSKRRRLQPLAAPLGVPFPVKTARVFAEELYHAAKGRWNVSCPQCRRDRRTKNFEYSAVSCEKFNEGK